MNELEDLAVVALLEDLPEHGLVRGQVGAVVMPLAPGAYEVEFCDNEGRTFALITLKRGQLLELHHEPVHKAA